PAARRQGEAVLPYHVRPVVHAFLYFICFPSTSPYFKSVIFLKLILFPFFFFFGSAYLELNGVNPKEHPVMKELTRVKQYFGKIKEAEAKTAGPSQQTLTLDKEAAGRFIKHAVVRPDIFQHPVYLQNTHLC